MMLHNYVKENVEIIAIPGKAIVLAKKRILLPESCKYGVMLDNGIIIADATMDLDKCYEECRRELYGIGI